MVETLLHPNGTRLEIPRVVERPFPSDHAFMPGQGRVVTTRFVLHPRADIPAMIRELQLPYHPYLTELHADLDKRLPNAIGTLKTGVPVMTDSNRPVTHPAGDYILWETHLWNPFTRGAQAAMKKKGFEGLQSNKIDLASEICEEHYAKWVAHLQRVVDRYNVDAPNTRHAGRR